MPNLLISLLIGSGPLFAAVEDFQHEVRGPRTCVVGSAPERCYKTLNLGEGIDVLTQLTKYAAAVDDEGNPRAGVELDLNDVTAMAAGTGVAPAGRRAVLDRFARLKVSWIASDIEAAQTAEAPQSATPPEVPFLAQIEWSEKSAPDQVNQTLVEGRLVNNGKDNDLSEMNAAQINQVFSELIRVDRVSNAGLDEDLIRGTIAPAVLGNEYVVVVKTMIEEFGKAIGDVINSVFSAIFGKDKDGAPAADAAPAKP